MTGKSRIMAKTGSQQSSKLVSQMLEQAASYCNTGKTDEAGALCHQILKTEPKETNALHLLGVIAAQIGQYDEAIRFFEQAIRIKNNIALFHYHLGLALQNKGRLDEAAEKYKRAIDLQPDYIEAHRNLAAVLLSLEKLDDSAKHYRKAIELKPDLAELYYNLNKVLIAQDKLNEAAEQLEKSIALKPDYAEAYLDLGVIRKQQGNLEEALTHYIKAVVVKPDYAMARYNLANSLRDGHHIEEAIEQYERAIILEPDFYGAYVNLSGIYKKQRRYNDAIFLYKHALNLKPDEAGLIADWINAQQYICDWDGLAEREAELLEMVRQGKNIPPFNILSLPSTPADQLTVARNRSKELKPASVFQHQPGRSRERIRIGYLSSDYHQHATAYLMAELFERHDRKHFETFAYSYGIDDNSPMRQRLIKAFDHFVDLRTLSDQAAAQKIYDDGIDILIDLKGGYTEDARMGIAARRPAPIQVNYIGYPGTMGADFIDYIIADRFIIPEHLEKFYSEKVVCLPDSYQPNDTAREIAKETPTRAECGLPEKGFVFCSFNNTYKITPSMFDIWMRLLKAVPGSVLWLLEANAYVKENLLREAANRGVSADRLVFAPRMPLPRHLARQRLADLFLDNLPVNAHTTTSDALWAGLPVLTCAGETFAGRVAGSLLTAAGLPELITYSLEDYEALALRLAQNPSQLSAIRKKIERTRLEMPLFDIERFVPNLEKAYTNMWQTWQSGKAPHSFAVENEPEEPRMKSAAKAKNPKYNSRIMYDACPLCSSKDIDTCMTASCQTHPLYNSIIDPEMVWKKCADCAHIFTDGYFTDEACGVIFSKTNENQKAGSEMEKQRYISARMVEKMLPFVQEGDWLDIGFGNGSLLFTAHEYGFHPVGIDLRKKNVEDMNKLGVEAHCVDLRDFDQPERFSVISMADVLEHVPYPKDFLRSVHGLLRDGGTVFVSMPNADSILWEQMTKAKANPYWGELEHFHNFGRKRLYSLLEECGFEPVRFGISERYRACMEVIARKTSRAASSGSPQKHTEHRKNTPPAVEGPFKTIEACQAEIQKLAAADEQGNALEIANLSAKMGEIFFAQKEFDNATQCFEATRILNPEYWSNRIKATGKNIINCVTTGRSGTNLLEKLLALADDTCALHEPKPAYHSVLQEVSHDPAAAVSFVNNLKLPYIFSRPEKNYAETSHVFGKGFFEAFTAMKLPFRLIILNREPREVAESLWRIKTIPNRTQAGKDWLLDPAQGNVLPLPGWQEMSDYQLCYWYCLEVERRKAVYKEQCLELGLPVVEISLEQLKDWNHFKQLCDRCGLTLPDTAQAAHSKIVATKVNPKSEHKAMAPAVPLAQQEQGVWKALGDLGEVMQAELAERYGHSFPAE